MRKIQKVLLGVLAAGVLLTGIGTGVALVEYSTLNYGGQKIIGEGSLVTNTFTYELDEKQKDFILLEGFDYNASRVTELIEDNGIPKNEIQYEVTYNEKRVHPYIWSSDTDESVNTKEEAVRVGLGMEYFRNEFADFMESKDLILNDLKNHTISTYEMTYVTKVLIKVNPETMKSVKKVN